MTRQTLVMDQFGGGLDLFSSLNTIEPGFTPNAKNFRIAETGGIEKILGYSAFATAGTSLLDLHYFQKKDASSKFLVGASATKWYSVSAAGTVTDIRTVVAADDTTFVAYEDKLYGLDPDNNIAYWPGTGSATAVAPGVNTAPPKGIILGIWQNRMWTAEAASGALGLTVRWSEPAGLTNGFVNETGMWPTDNNVVLGGSGQSERIVGGVVCSAGLLVFTNASTFLIYDTDGSNRVVDAERGCSSRRSLALIGDSVYGLTTDGVFATDGSFPLQIVSGNVEPLFRNERPNLSLAAGVKWNNAYLGSYARTGTANSLTLDVSTKSEAGRGLAVMANDYPAASWARGDLEGAASEDLYFIDASDPTKVRKAFSGGSFAGTDIACHFQTRFENFGSEALLKRLHRVRLVGRGDLLLAVRVDNRQSNADSELLGFPSFGGGEWDSAEWDVDTWGGWEQYEGWANLRARGRRFSLVITETSSAVGYGRTPLDGTNPPDIGSAGVFLLEPRFTTSTRNR